jgi:Cation transporter/ATPase, N-terminus
LGSRTGGLSEDEAARRLQVVGPNAVRAYRVRALPVLVRQLRSPLLVLLALTAITSAFLGEATDAVIIGIILAASVGLGFVNEYHAEKTAEALHSTVHHSCVVVRDGHPRTADLTNPQPLKYVHKAHPTRARRRSSTSLAPPSRASWGQHLQNLAQEQVHQGGRHALHRHRLRSQDHAQNRTSHRPNRNYEPHRLMPTICHPLSISISDTPV